MFFDYSAPISFHFEITDKCNARCPQCSRNTIDETTGVISERTDLLNKNITIDEYKKIFEGFNLQLGKMLYCGNFGDPIANKHFIDIIEYTVNELKPKYIQINTNGSVKTKDWWFRLGQILKDQPHNLIFAIDGLEDTHYIYRVNTNYDKIINNAKAFIAGGGTAEWSLIIFKHNQHQVEIAKARAKELGFATFCAVETQRFRNNDELRYKFKGEDFVIEPADVNKEEIKNITTRFNADEEEVQISCVSKNRNEVFIDPAGEIYPCCWVGSRDYSDRNFKVNMEKDAVYEMRPSINCIEKPLLECMDDDWFNYVLEMSFTHSPCKTCKRICGYGLRKKNNRSEL